MAKSARQIGELTSKLAKPLLQKQGFAQADIVLRWAAIMGGELAAHSRPEKIAYNRADPPQGTLHLAVESAFALEAQHNAPVIIDRINTYYGFPAIARLAIRQDAVDPGRKSRPAPPAPLSASAARELEKSLASLADSDLKAALERLGREVLAG